MTVFKTARLKDLGNFFYSAYETKYSTKGQVKFVEHSP